jgi:hypothetical protein
METPQPLFILTCMRSYSSLVSTMLGQHPRAYGLLELNLFVAERVGELINFLPVFRPNGLNGLLRTIANLEFGEQTEEAVRKAYGWLKKRESWKTGDIMHHILERTSPLLCIEKSPSICFREMFIRRMFRMFPNARFLHLVRHPRSTCRSIYTIMSRTDHMKQSNTADQTDQEELWFRMNSHSVKFSDLLSPGQYMRIQGELLLGKPDLYFPQILEWLGLESSRKELKLMKHPENSPYACVGPQNAPFGNDPNFLRNSLFVQRPIPPESLEDPMDWRGNGEMRVLSESTKRLARVFGYQ